MDTTEILDPLCGSSVDEVAELLNAVERATGREPLSEHKAIGFRARRAGSVGVLVRSGAQLCAYAQLETANRPFTCEIAVVPDDSDGRREELASELLAGVTATVTARGGGEVSLFLSSPTDGELESARRAGFAPSRELLVLRRPTAPSDLDVPADPAVRTFRVGADEDAWIALNARAFAWHPEQGTWDRSTIEDRERESWFSADGLLLYWDDARLLGTCWTKVHEAPEFVGEIYVLSVDPDAQHTGLGRRLLALGLAHLAGVGVPSTILYVEGDNDPAVGLYRRFGFTNDARTVVATARVAPR